jgi:hypothetical protein
MNSISGMGGGLGLGQNMYGLRKPNSEEMAQQLFAKLDTLDQGYIGKSELQSALQKVSSTSEITGLSTDENEVDALFSQLDTDGDGKVTEQEFTDSIAAIEEQISNLFSQMRMNEAMGGAMPPPPPPPPEGENDIGFTQEELTAQLEQIGSSDPKRASFIESIIANLDEADADGDGRVKFQEAMAFNQASESAEESTSSAGNESEISSSEKVMLQILRLMQAYSLAADTDSEDSSTLSVSA